MKIACVSDLHGYLPEIPPADLLLIAGDICPLDIQRNHESCVNWLNNEFAEWIKKTAIPTFVIAGNHDFVFQQKINTTFNYLQDSAAEFSGLNIWGTPWQPVFFNWAFNATEEQLKEKWDLIPANTDILVVHGPPYMAGDLTINHIRTGSSSLRERIEAIQPKLVVCGHIHEGRGVYKIKDTIVINASMVDERYQIHFDVPVIEI